MFNFLVGIDTFVASVVAEQVALYAIVIVTALMLIISFLSMTPLAKKVYRFISALKAVIFKSKDKQNLESLDEIIEDSGYKYDPRQDIFYSHLEAWQKKFGYCRLYDEAAAPLGMIIDCEPIYFEYKSKKWLIELWKGQYDLTTGCEIGIYTTDNPKLNIPGIGSFYHCANEDEQLQMAYLLKKNGKTLFTRAEKHWWLTGFKLGEFSEPSELKMIVKIELKDLMMCQVFVEALRKLGYNEIKIMGNVVSFKFDRPHSAQPITRTTETDGIIQKNNKVMCDEFQELTKAYTYLPDKLTAIKNQDPNMYGEALKIGKTRKLFEVYEVITKYL